MSVTDREDLLRSFDDSEAKGEGEVLSRVEDGSQGSSEKARTYLILHKVRGEPAFDIAERCGMCKEPCQPQCGLWPGCQDEGWWIIPTSGHTAHPWWHQPLGEIVQNDIMELVEGGNGALPKDWPDHYPLDVGTETKISAGAILSKLLPKIHRRL